MTLVDAAPGPNPSTPSDVVPPPRHAPWGARVGAVVVDHALLAAAAFLVVPVQPVTPLTLPGLPPTTTWGLADLPGTAPTGGHLAGMLALVGSFMLLQAYAGATPGKLAVGIRVVRADDRRPAGLWRTAARSAAHLLDGILLIGFLRPLWHRERRTFADSIVGTVVVPHRPPVRPRALVVALAVPALLLTYAPQTGRVDGPVWFAHADCDQGPESEEIRLTGGRIDASPGAPVTVERLGVERTARTPRAPGVRVVWDTPGTWEAGDEAVLTVEIEAPGAPPRTAQAHHTMHGTEPAGPGRADGDALLLPWSFVEGLRDPWHVTLSAATTTGEDLGRCSFAVTSSAPDAG